MGLAGREHVSSARPPLVRILFVPQRRRARLDIGLSGMELPTRRRGVWVSGPAETAANRVLGVCRGTGGGVWPPLKLHHAALAAGTPAGCRPDRRRLWRRTVSGHRGTASLPPKRWRGFGCPLSLIRHDRAHEPVPSRNWRWACRSEPSVGSTSAKAPIPQLVSHFAAVRVRPAHRDYNRTSPNPRHGV